MFSYTQVEEKLSTSKWSEYAVSTLLPTLPRLGKWSLSFLWTHLHAYMEGEEANDIAQIISSEPHWYDAILRNDSTEISEVVKMAVDNYDTIESQAVLSVILDMRSNKEVAESISQELSHLMDELEVLHMVELPPYEVVNMLTFRINNIVTLGDLNMEIKAYLYYKDAFDPDEEEIVRFRQALENNNQLIGANNPRPVKQWIKLFGEMAVTSNARSTYNVAFFMINSKEAQTLTELEKTVLAEILQLHNWLFQPMVTEQEVKGYERQKFLPTEEIVVPPARTQIPVVTPVANTAPVAPDPTPIQNFNGATVGTYEEQKAPERLPDSAYTGALAPVEPKLAEPTEEQRKILEGIQRAKHQSGKYGDQGAMDSSTLSAADNARIHDLINQKLSEAATKRGVTMDPTNIKIDEERKRIDDQRSKQVADIQKKLAELRERNKISK